MNLGMRVLDVRHVTQSLCEGLEAEDMTVQPIADVSPLKWHLAHTSWFFEELILCVSLPGYKRFDEGYRELFNSYYKSLGRHWVQGDRGSLSRPSVREILAYRKHVNDGLRRLFERPFLDAEVKHLLELGIQHEEQHQELFLMDVKYILSRNPCEPIFRQTPLGAAEKPSANWINIPEQIAEIGVDLDPHAFTFDNERPRHKVYVYPFSIRESLVTNAEFLCFIEEGGYQNPEYWLSLGWEWVNAHTVKHPLYWAKQDDRWTEYTLHGTVPLEPNYPVTHISYFEASAFARWSKARLPREEELEIYLAKTQASSLRSDLHPTNANQSEGQVWCWTQSAYSAYPGYQEFSGAVREYNGKFMCNQFVLRGGCAVTPKGHARATYRNFFLPEQRWMFSGLRLAKDSR
ncbi:MAG: ergothioneine biosynthesis protein EgtB [Proteobacteria bacterium]|nr:MAG: ergothioneine biosynthesis protein EgtB [Pseudomonadota bacterium]